MRKKGKLVLLHKPVTVVHAQACRLIHTEFDTGQIIILEVGLESISPLGSPACAMYEALLIFFKHASERLHYFGLMYV